MQTLNLIVFSLRSRFSQMNLLVIIVTSFLSSIPVLFVANLDPDFFAFYYVSDGLLNGQAVYNDFADNKMFVFYTVIALLKFLFDDNYRLGMFIGLGLIDAVTAYFLIENAKRLLNIKSVATTTIVLIVVLLKSFNITQEVTGIYSETVGLMFLSIALYYCKEKTSLITGVFLALAFFCRQTLLVYILVPIVSLYLTKKRFVTWDLTKVFLGFGLTSTIVLILIFLNGNDIHKFLDNTVFFNLQMGKHISPFKLVQFIVISVLELRIVLLSVIMTVETILLRKDKLENYPQIATIYVCGWATILGGGLFYTHHFIQLAPIFVIALIALNSRLYKNVMVYRSMIAAFLLLLFLNYHFEYLIKGKSYISSQIGSTIQSDVQSWKYMQVVNFYPQLYIDLEKKSPDRYFQPFFISKIYTKNPDLHKTQHARNLTPLLNETVFVIPVFNYRQEVIAQEYINRFEKDFSLVQFKYYEFSNGYVYLLKSDPAAYNAIK